MTIRTLNIEDRESGKNWSIRQGRLWKQKAYTKWHWWHLRKMYPAMLFGKTSDLL